MASFACDHGDYAAEINTNWLGIAGPGVARTGLDGTAAADGPSSAGPGSGQVTVPGSGTAPLRRFMISGISRRIHPEKFP